MKSKSALKKAKYHKSSLTLPNLTAFLVALFVFLSFNPFFLWGFEYSQSLKLLFDISFCLFIFCCFFILPFKQAFFWVLPLVFAWGVLRYLGKDNDLYVVELSGWALKTFFILMLPSPLLFRSGFYFGNILAFFSLFSIAGFFSIFFFGSALGEFNLLNPYEGKALLGQEYVGFYFGSYLDYLKSCDSGYCISRMNGALDEPGLWGTLCALYLSAYKLDVTPLRNKFIIISGFLTFSLAFYVLILLAAVLLSFRRGLHVILIAVLISFCFYTVSYDYFNSFIMQRFDFDALLFQRGAEPLLGHIKSVDIYGLFFGSGYLSSLDIAPGASSWLVHVYEGGLVLVALMLLVYAAIYILYAKSYSSLYYFPVIIVSFIQRPEIVWVGYLYLYLLSFQRGCNTSGDSDFRKDNS